MPAGEFDRVITIQTPTTVEGARGGVKKTLAPHAVVWASFKPTRANDKIVNAQRTTLNTAVFKIRYRDDITTDMVINHNGTDWGIISTTELGRKHNLEILAREGVE